MKGWLSRRRHVFRASMPTPSKSKYRGTSHHGYAFATSDFCGTSRHVGAACRLFVGTGARASRGEGARPTNSKAERAVETARTRAGSHSRNPGTEAIDLSAG